MSGLTRVQAPAAGVIGPQDPLEDRQQRIATLLEEAVARLEAELPQAEIGALLHMGRALRHVAHAGSLRLIYEVPRERGGVAWRAAERGEAQLVEDVRSDPDYLASDSRVHSEIAAPVTWLGEVVAVLDIEFPARVFTAAEAEAVRAEVRRVEGELAS
jgi:putative methionine-R-sulfoxide reductase with GAF domain